MLLGSVPKLSLMSTLTCGIKPFWLYNSISFFICGAIGLWIDSKGWLHVIIGFAMKFIHCANLLIKFFFLRIWLILLVLTEENQFWLLIPRILKNKTKNRSEQKYLSINEWIWVITLKSCDILLTMFLKVIRYTHGQCRKNIIKHIDVLKVAGALWIEFTVCNWN